MTAQPIGKNKDRLPKSQSVPIWAQVNAEDLPNTQQPLQLFLLAMEIASSASSSSAIITNVELRNLIIECRNGSFDAARVTIQDRTVDVNSTAGNALGERDFDTRMVDFIRADLKRKARISLSDTGAGLKHLRIVCKSTHRRACSHPSVSLKMGFPCGTDYTFMLERAMLHELNVDYFCPLQGPIEKFLQDSGIKKGNVHEAIVLYGNIA